MEKKIQKEREMEGDEFKDKEAFLTTAYKKKLQEKSEEEEREKKEAELEGNNSSFPFLCWLCFSDLVRRLCLCQKR